MRFPNWIAGRPVNEGNLIAIRDFRGAELATFPGCATVDVIEARIHAAAQRRIPNRRAMAERVALLRELVADYLADPRLGLIAAASGTPQAYLDETVRGLRVWSDGLEEFLECVDRFSHRRDGKGLEDRIPVSPFAVISAGNSEIYEPPYLLGQMILAGAHFIVRPSGKDLGTHLFMEKLADRGFADVGQKLAWSSIEHPELVKQLLRFCEGFAVFASDTMYDSIVRIVSDGEVFEDLAVGRRAHRYGSGYALAVVTDRAEIEEAVRRIVRAASFNKGDKCWAVTNVFVQRGVLEPLSTALVEHASQLVAGDPRDPRTELPSFPSGALADLQSLLPPRPLHGTIRPEECRLDLLVYGPEAEELALREIGAPVVVLLPFADLEDASARILHTMARRGTDALLSLGVFGSPDDAERLAATIPHHNLKLNGDLKVDVFLPHQGSYFMLDASQ